MVKFIDNQFAKVNIWAYLKEAILTLFLDIAIWVIIWFLYLCFNNTIGLNYSYIIIINVAYFLIAIILHYLIAALVVIDIAKGDIIRKSVNIIDFSIESSWSGDRLMHSRVSRFFPKNMLVDRFKLYYVNDLYKKQYVRLIMSKEKRRIVYDAFVEDDSLNNVEIVYLKRSKVLLFFDIPIKKHNKKTENIISKLNNII